MDNLLYNGTLSHEEIVFLKREHLGSVIVSDLYETRPSQTIGEYRLVRKLGGGGFGSVYLAKHIHDHSQVALKILKVPLTKSEDFREFLNETRTMIRLRHSHIIPLLDVGLSPEDFPFLVMEYASEGTIRDRHPRGSQVPLIAIAEYVEQIASALQYAHDHRIIHRDVKPENMLLRADGTLLLSDFGLAKIIERSTFISMQQRIGTPAYMAPEQHRGYPCFASDQYALAVVVYEWISSTLPFQGSPLGIVVQHMTAPPFPLLSLLPTLPPPIEQVIFKALSKVPEKRFATIQEFANALSAAVQQASVSQVDINHLPLAEPSLRELLSRQSLISESIPAGLSIAIEPPILTDHLTEPEVAQVKQSSDQMNTPVPSNQSDTAEPEVTQIKQSSDQMNTPVPSKQLDTPVPRAETSSSTHSPAISPSLAAGKLSSAVKLPKRLSPLTRNLILLMCGLLVVSTIIAIFINSAGVKVQHQQKVSHTAVSRSPHHELALNASTVSSLVKKWTFQTGGDHVESSPAVVGGVVYIGAWDGNVYAIDVQSGQKKWAFDTERAVKSSPAVVDGVIYIGSDDGNVYALDAQSGQKKWAFQTGDSVSSAPVVVGRVVYVGSQDNNVYALDAQSGQENWAFHTGGSAYVSSQDPSLHGQLQGPLVQGPPPGQGPPPARPSSPTVVNGIVYIGATDSNVYAIDAQSGQKKWAFQTGSSIVSSPAVVGGIVYVNSNDGNVYALDAQSGQENWAFPTGRSMASSSQGRPPPPISSSPAVVGGVVYVGSIDHNVYALDAQSGQKKWAFQTGFLVVSSPAVADGVVYVGSFDHNVYGLDAQSGQKKWAFQTGDIVHSSPAVAGGMVYVGSFDGNVYAFGLPATTS
jgi:serine/threonine-protein kinase